MEGRAAANNPVYGGMPANSAYAIDWGITTNATLTPASRSPRENRFAEVVATRANLHRPYLEVNVSSDAETRPTRINTQSLFFGP